jgi:oligopeptide transport system permease protein
MTENTNSQDNSGNEPLQENGAVDISIDTVALDLLAHDSTAQGLVAHDIEEHADSLSTPSLTSNVGAKKASTNPILKVLFSPIAQFIFKRVLQAIPVFLGSTLIVYALIFLMPGDPVRAMFGDKPPSEGAMMMVRAQYNLDKPFIIQYLLFLKGIFTFNFGMTFSGQPIIDIIMKTLPTTFYFALFAFVLEAIIGLAVGIFVGLRKGSWVDSATTMITLVLISIPTFVMGTTLQFFLGTKWHIFPSTVDKHFDIQHLFLPALILATVSIASVVRLTRSYISETSRFDFVRTARAKGLTKSSVNTKHILRNSLIPVVTYLGIDFVTLMAGAIITEAIFNINGMGNMMFRYILAGEGPAVVSIATLFMLFYTVSNIIIDVIYAFLDPRIRIGKGSE